MEVLLDSLAAPRGAQHETGAFDQSGEEEARREAGKAAEDDRRQVQQGRGRGLRQTDPQQPLTSADEKVLLEPYHYLCRQPGKEFRTKMIEAFDVWLRVPPEHLVVIKNVVQMLHTASLLIDDVEDGSALRRGVPVAHKIYGVPTTINSANYVYFLALEEVQKLRNPDMIKIFTEELLDLHRGQGMDLFWRDNFICPTEEQYIDMVNKKTGGLLRLAVKLMQEASESSLDCVPLVNTIGVYFQIRDDYMNLQSREYSDNKGFCEDLTEGKFSFPVLHSIHADKTNRALINILKQRTSDMEVKKYAVKLMHATNSFEYTLACLARVERTARALIAELGGNPEVQEIMDHLAKGLDGVASNIERRPRELR